MEEYTMFTPEMLAAMTTEEMEALATALRNRVEAESTVKLTRVKELRNIITEANTELGTLRLWFGKHGISIPREKSDTPVTDAAQENALSSVSEDVAVAESAKVVDKKSGRKGKAA
jgi:hypothetical protein